MRGLFQVERPGKEKPRWRTGLFVAYRAKGEPDEVGLTITILSLPRPFRIIKSM